MGSRSGAAAEETPELSFAVAGAEAVEHAATPTLRFRLRIETEGATPVRFVSLQTQVRIAAGRRGYDESAGRRLAEVFGAPEQWSRSMRSLFWTSATTQVPPFSGGTEVELLVPCTYDFEVLATKYLHAVEDGEIPLEFLFSGSVFYAAPGGALRTSRIPWESEAEYGMPVRVWREAMDRHFPDTAWVRLRRDVFDRLYAYKAERSLPTWEAALEELLGAAEPGPE